MKRVLFSLILALCCLPLCAKDRDWQDAVFLGTSSAQTGAFAMPLGTGIIAAPIRTSHYWFKMKGLNYCLWFPSRLSGRAPNLTVNGHTRISIEGRHAHVLDDDGKDWKLVITMKVAPAPPVPPVPPPAQ